MNYTFWKDKRVLVTGHTGFKGSWLTMWLQRMGAAVTGYALTPPTEPNLFEIAGVAKGMEDSIIGDVRDFDTLKDVISKKRPEIIFHLAAQPLVRYSYRHPVETYSTNIMGTVHVLDAVRQAPGTRAILCITSDKCYQNNEWVWGYRENEAMGGHDPYASSKGCAELIIAAYRNSFFPPDRYADHGVAVGSARAGNVIGGGDWAADRLIPDIVKAFIEGRPVVIRSPHAIRPWQHVLEPLYGYITLAEKLWEQGAAFAQGWGF